MPLHSKPLQALLKNPRQAGIYHLPDSGQGLIKAAAALGFACFEVDFADATKLDVVLDKFGLVLDFPDWYGRNLDALKDCLTDLSWCEAAGYVLLVTRAESFHAENSGDFRRLNQVFELVIAEWQAMECPFWVFYDLRPDGLARLPTLA
ncbi:MAG: barstar family protein [Candidatus Accumulibacter sp.]|nr:barstar family protein [Accumulibacter sp.]